MRQKDRDFSRLIKEAGKLASTPAFVCDVGIVEENILELHNAFDGRADIRYAVKANNDPGILSVIVKTGSGFDVASAAEIDLALQAGATPESIFFSNPVKIPEHVTHAHRVGVRQYCADSIAEIDKLAMFAPGSSVYVRISVDNSGSGWPLSRKFGVVPQEAVAILDYARARGLETSGLTFHVGSQCENVDSWRKAIHECAIAWKEAEKRGIKLSMLNIGGGFPAKYGPDAPSFKAIADACVSAITELGLTPGQIIIEPGRAIVADAVVLMSTVIGKKRHGGQDLVFLDIGLFNGLMEAYEKFWLPVRNLAYDAGERQIESYCLVGPTCDSVDVIAEEVRLPRLDIGDRVVFLYAGAYTNSYESYNGFPYPTIFHLGKK